jgi:hypothetical protein
VPDKRTEHQWKRVIIIGRLNKSGVNFNDNFDENPKCRFKLAARVRWQDNGRTDLVDIFAAGKDAKKKIEIIKNRGPCILKGLVKTGKYEKDGEIKDQISNLALRG